MLPGARGDWWPFEISEGRFENLSLVWECVCFLGWSGYACTDGLQGTDLASFTATLDGDQTPAAHQGVQHVVQNFRG